MIPPPLIPYVTSLLKQLKLLAVCHRQILLLDSYLRREQDSCAFSMLSYLKITLWASARPGFMAQFRQVSSGVSYAPFPGLTVTESLRCKLICPVKCEKIAYLSQKARLSVPKFVRCAS